MLNKRSVFINAEDFKTPWHSGILSFPSEKKKDVYLMGQCFRVWMLMVNIKMVHNKTWFADVDWIQLAQGRDKGMSPVNMVLNMFLIRSANVSFLRTCLM
jgi:hypothetical protein